MNLTALFCFNEFSRSKFRQVNSQSFFVISLGQLAQAGRRRQAFHSRWNAVNRLSDPARLGIVWDPRWDESRSTQEALSLSHASRPLTVRREAGLCLLLKCGAVRSIWSVYILCLPASCLISLMIKRRFEALNSKSLRFLSLRALHLFHGVSISH